MAKGLLLYTLNTLFGEIPTSLKDSLHSNGETIFTSSIRRLTVLLRDIHQSKHTTFEKTPYFLSEDGSPDYLSTCFYMINSIQEYNAPEESFDEFGRFRFESSYQHRFDCLEKNLVQSYLKKVITRSPLLSRLPVINEPSKIFFSHDIDVINAAIWQESKTAIKQWDIALLLKIIFRYFLKGPSYRDMDRIMDIHDEYDVKSTFFWLVEKSNSFYQRDIGIPQSDYNIRNKDIQIQIGKIRSRKFENGLHKSSLHSTLDEEVVMLGHPVIANRNHYLKLKLPVHYDALDKSSIKLDFSLGFGQHYGFRNSFGRPFIPFNLKENKPYSFLEVPLQIMDTTFKYHLKIDPEKSKLRILDLLDKNRKNCTISVLWHNDMFSPIKNPGWLKLYLEILDFCRFNEIKSTNQGELLKVRSSLLNSFRNNFL